MDGVFNIYVHICLLSVLSVVGMKILDVSGHVGSDVTFECSSWDVDFNVALYTKYLSTDRSIFPNGVIVKASPGQTAQKNRIHIFNRGQSLIVTFTDLQKSDSKKYYCGLTRTGFDNYIKVNLAVEDAPVPSIGPPVASTGPPVPSIGPPVPSTGPPVVVCSPDVSPSDPSGATVTSPHPNITAMTAATQGPHIIPFLVVGIVFAVLTLMPLLKVLRTMIRRKETDLRRIDSPQEFSQANVEYTEIGFEDRQAEGQSEVRFSSSDSNTDANVLYANSSYLQRTELAADCKNKHAPTISSCASEATRKGAGAQRSETNLLNNSIYSVVQLPTEQPQTSRTGGVENDSFYALAQLPQAT